MTRLTGARCVVCLRHVPARCYRERAAAPAVGWYLLCGECRTVDAEAHLLPPARRELTTGGVIREPATRGVMCTGVWPGGGVC